MNLTPQQQQIVNSLMIPAPAGPGYTYQQAVQMVMQQQGQASPFGMQPQYMQPITPMQQMLTALFSPQVIGATQAPYNLQMQAANIGMHPQQLTSLINQATQQLSPALIHAVTRATTPSIASRGLATSPGMSQQMVAEALAPYQMDEQKLAADTVMGGMGLPFGVGSGLAGEYPGTLQNFANIMGAQP